MKYKKLLLAAALSTAFGIAAAETAASPDFEGANLPFTWQNALVYFAITDRYANGNPSNDNSYGRPSVDGKGNKTGTFHGGDIRGMTEKLDYIRSLGVSALWISAPYEQSHGFTGGGGMGLYAHYAYHGYYGLDFTSLDANMGTIEEFRTFVKEAHRRGIRVLLDVVMNHTGYATLKDMCDFKFGKTVNNYDPCVEWVPGDKESYHQKPIDESEDPAWDRWWGKDYLIFGGYGERCGAGAGLDECIAFLPDFKNSDPKAPIVGVPQFLAEKWQTPNPDYDIPAAIPFRQGNMSVAQFQAAWLSSWVREFGIDGFRCDTVKHVTKESWHVLREACDKALADWRQENLGKDPAAAWIDRFYMVGEAWGFTNDPDDIQGYASKAGFDAMIDFSLNSDPHGRYGCTVPGTSTLESYARMYGQEKGKVNLNALVYLSSHDTSLCRVNRREEAIGLLLLNGGTEIFYGDETFRVNDGGGVGDTEQGTRSDMNFPEDVANAPKWAEGVASYGTEFTSDNDLALWQKIGQFRLRNPAVGAGAQDKLDDNGYCRYYTDAARGIDNKVVIHLGRTDSVLTGKCFADGTKVQDAITGAEYTVEGGKVPAASDELVLLEVKR